MTNGATAGPWLNPSNVVDDPWKYQAPTNYTLQSPVTLTAVRTVDYCITL